MVEAGGVTRFIPKSMFSMLSSLFGKVLFDFGDVGLHLPPAILTWAALISGCLSKSAPLGSK